MKNKSKTSESSGFTLLEILISIMAFSIVISALFSSFKAFAVSSEQIKQSLTGNEGLRGGLGRIRMDLSAVFVLQEPRYKKPGFNSDPDPFRFEGKELTINGRLVSTLTFSSMAHVGFGPKPRPGVARITYYIKENEDQTLDLFRGDALYPYPEEVESCNDPLLFSQISGFEVVYIDREGEEHRHWDSDSDEFNYTYPTGLILRILLGQPLEGEEQGNASVFETTIPLAAGRDPIE